MTAKTGSQAPAIRVQGLVKQYGAVRAVDGIDFEVPAGTVTGLLGGNGAGKTTTIAMLLGLVLPSLGRIEIFGVDAVADRYRVLPSMNFESPYVEMPLRLTVRQNLTVYGRLYGVADLKARIAELAGDLELGEILDRPTGKLSAGQKTRVSLAKALINAPRILLLDEPTASLDPDTADWVRSHLERYRTAKGATILLASHNMSEVERLCTDVVMMKAGRIVGRGSPEALIRQYGRTNMEEVFLDMARGRRREAAE
ncbi:ABC transporter ATP-binding protein [Kaustia mangrovi]|uniref:ABC transporter ATP-binding protein n=1 Tax=Kaustia mangrovi TaxID=2593653 RepID=A0A7S8HC97_9HYPH|nr:ABC transporter ATP-binding protein [Kaustia mangrovi]QPC43396.1 ABC transporter ATP-binding protein [Kaustia mangrovi]